MWISCTYKYFVHIRDKVYTIQIIECSFRKRQSISAHKAYVNIVYVTTVRKLKNEGYIMNKSVCNVTFNLHSEKHLETKFEVIKNYDLTTFRATD